MAANDSLILRLLFPPDTVCLACGALRVDMRAYGLCSACAGTLTPLAGPFCPRCGREGWHSACTDCQPLAPDALDARIAAFAYAGVAGALVRALKYESVLQAATPLADAMAALPLPDADALVAVPLHPLRQRQRGFNQAQVLAEAVAQRTGLPVLDALDRVRNTRTQTRLSVSQREQNVRDAFLSKGPALGLRVLLIDDVLTSGATAVACANSLKIAGAQHVTLLAATKAKQHET